MSTRIIPQVFYCANRCCPHYTEPYITEWVAERVGRRTFWRRPMRCPACGSGPDRCRRVPAEVAGRVLERYHLAPWLRLWEKTSQDPSFLACRLARAGLTPEAVAERLGIPTWRACALGAVRVQPGDETDPDGLFAAIAECLACDPATIKACLTGIL